MKAVCDRAVFDGNANPLARARASRGVRVYGLAAPRRDVSPGAKRATTVAAPTRTKRTNRSRSHNTRPRRVSRPRRRGVSRHCTCLDRRSALTSCAPSVLSPRPRIRAHRRNSIFALFDVALRHGGTIMETRVIALFIFVIQFHALCSR